MANRKDKLASLARNFDLSPGNHASPEEGMCAMELVAFLDGTLHTDRPRCTSETIADFVRHVNDHIPDQLRYGLLPFVPRLIDTVSEEHEQARIEYFAWQTIRVFAPAALRARRFRRFASTLANSKDFYRAREVAEKIRHGIAKREGGGGWGQGFTATWCPADLAVHRAFRAASAAMYSYDRDLLFFDEYSQCGYLAASAAFQAYEAGCADIWERVFETLEGVLAIGDPAPHSLVRMWITKTLDA